MRPLLLAAVVASSPVLATEVVILGGGKTPAEAERVARQFEKVKDSFADGFPKQVRSDDVPGLKPGFHLLVGGFCADKAGALRAAKALAQTVKGVYTRTVTAAQPESCPNAAIAEDPQAAPFLKKILADPKSVTARYEYGAHLHQRGLLDEAEAELEKALELDPQHAPSLELLRTIAVLKMD